MWLSGSVNTINHLTEFCYDEGVEFYVTCQSYHEAFRATQEVMWRLYADYNYNYNLANESGSQEWVLLAHGRTGGCPHMVQTFSFSWNVDADKKAVRDEVGITEGYQPLPKEPAHRSQVTMSLTKKHDDWLLKCYGYDSIDDGFFIIVYESTAVRFRMRRDDVCQVSYSSQAPVSCPPPVSGKLGVRSHGAA
ncbi:hypothetical protein EVAR_35537_1 [Eumeta japonica]|uniref:Uncharacterized protein n=1 Tax=Eumeta variegata TaxID=151549 RepID=A0A4C1X4V3_EUMVA|nr:hypothetical protein EVAR_35537_1 [Eumeta japonica]